MSAATITATVHGTVRFPEHPDHEGGLGLNGGEDVTTERQLVTLDAAAAWVKDVLVHGLTVPGDDVEWQGPRLTPHTPPYWTQATVRWAEDPTVHPDDDTDRVWRTYDGLHWYEVDGSGADRAVPRPAL